MDQPGSVVVYKKDIGKQRFWVRYWVVSYIINCPFSLI